MPKSTKNRIYDANGWYEVDANPIARSGIFDYLGSQISSELELDRIYKVWRPESELNNPDTIKSFELVPWIPRHAMMGDQFGTPAESVGVQGVTGENVYFDTITKELKSKIKAFGSNLISMIDDLGVKDLSVGMTCDWNIQGGVTPDGEAYDVIQTNIRGNHLASVPVGRAGGNVAVMDSADVLSFAMDELNFQKTDQKNEGDTMTLEELMKAIAGLSPEDKAKLKESIAPKKAEDEDDKEKDAEKPKAEDEDEDPEEKAPKGAMDAAAIRSIVNATVAEAVKGFAIDEAALGKRINAEINTKNALVEKVAPLTGAFDHSGMSVQEVAVYATKKLNIACDSGHEIATLKGFLAAQKVQTIVRDSNAQDSSDTVTSKTSDEMGL